MTQNIREELIAWEREKHQRKELKMLREQVQNLNQQVTTLVERLIPPEPEPNNEPETTPEPEAPALLIDDEPEVEVPPLNLLQRLKAPAKAGREARKLAREKRRNPSQKSEVPSKESKTS